MGAIQTYSLDMAFGADEQDFEITFSTPRLSGGELLYIDGTEYGGIIDAVVQSTESDAVLYKGRTWHGMLAGKIIQAPSGSDYYTLSGEANACIASLLAYVDLDGVLTASTEDSGITVNYQFNRFANAYDGLLRMLASAEAVLRIQRHDGITEVWAEPRNTITNEADSDLMAFTITDSIRVPNHLVCAGEGELKERVVVDLYADADGNVSQVQTFSGVDEITVLYDYSNADAATLINEGTKELESYQQGGGADVSINNVGEWHVGDKIQVRDNSSGIVVTSTIAKKIAKVDLGILTVDYEIGAASAQSYGGGGVAETNLITPPANGGTGVTYGFEWQELGHVTGATAISFATSIYSEVMVLAKAAGYLGSVVLPIAALLTTAQEVYLTGGKNGGAGTADGRACAASMTTTGMTPVLAIVDGSNVLASTTFYVYAR